MKAVIQYYFIIVLIVCPSLLFPNGVDKSLDIINYLKNNISTNVEHLPSEIPNFIEKVIIGEWTSFYITYKFNPDNTCYINRWKDNISASGYWKINNNILTLTINNKRYNYELDYFILHYDDKLPYKYTLDLIFKTKLYISDTPELRKSFK